MRTKDNKSTIINTQWGSQTKTESGIWEGFFLTRRRFWAQGSSECDPGRTHMIPEKSRIGSDRILHNVEKIDLQGGEHRCSTLVERQSTSSSSSRSWRDTSNWRWGWQIDSSRCEHHLGVHLPHHPWIASPSSFPCSWRECVNDGRGKRLWT